MARRSTPITESRRNGQWSSARQFFRSYVYQVTVEGVYHADPHRGNVLLTYGRFGLRSVDFGLLGRLDERHPRWTLSLLLLAIGPEPR